LSHQARAAVAAGTVAGHFDIAAAIQFAVGGRGRELARSAGRNFVGIHRFDELGRDEDQQLDVVSTVRNAAERHAGIGQVGQPRNAAVDRIFARENEARDDHRLAGLHFDGRVSRPLAEARHARDRVAQAGIDFGNVGSHFQADHAIAQHDRHKVDLRAE
jgi:hypothetical protein